MDFSTSSASNGTDHELKPLTQAENRDQVDQNASRVHDCEGYMSLDGDAKQIQEERWFSFNTCYLGSCNDLREALQGWVKNELIAIFKLSLPIMLTQVCLQSLYIVSMIFAGHITDGRSLELDGAALAISFTNITGVAVGNGLAFAADTLCSQIYGYKNYFGVGRVFQRGVLILGLVALFIWSIWLNTETLLLLLQQSPCVARLAGEYVQIFTVALIPYFVYVMLQKYLNSQSIVWPFVWGGILGNVINAGLQAALIFGAGLGVDGIAVSVVVVNIFQPVFVIVFVRARGQHKETWGGWSMDALMEWWPFLQLGIPGAIMFCLDWMSYEAANFILGTLDEVQLALGIIIFNLLVLIYMVAYGISVAATVRVGNELGAGRPKEAKRAAYICLIVATCIGLFFFTVIQSTQNVLGHLFSSDATVLEGLPILLNVLSVICVTDSLQITAAGVLRGSGYQLVGAIGNFVAFYIIGLPVGIVLAMVHGMEALGMWIGLALASFMQFIIFTGTVVFINWKKEAIKASERAIAEQSKIQAIDYEKIDNNMMTETSPTSLNPSLMESKSCSDYIPLETDKNQEHPEKKTAQEAPSRTWRQYVSLLLSKGSVYLLGALLVVGAGIASQYHPPDAILNGNYTECSDNATTTNLTVL